MSEEQYYKHDGEEFKGFYGMCSTSFHVDFKGRVFVDSDGDGLNDNVILNEAKDAIPALKAIRDLVVYRLSQLESLDIAKESLSHED